MVKIRNSENVLFSRLFLFLLPFFVMYVFGLYVTSGPSLLSIPHSWKFSLNKNLLKYLMQWIFNNAVKVVYGWSWCKISGHTIFVGLADQIWHWFKFEVLITKFHTTTILGNGGVFRQLPGETYQSSSRQHYLSGTQILVGQQALFPDQRGQIRTHSTSAIPKYN